MYTTAKIDHPYRPVAKGTSLLPHNARRGGLWPLVYGGGRFFVD